MVDAGVVWEGGGWHNGIVGRGGPWARRDRPRATSRRWPVIPLRNPTHAATAWPGIKAGAPVTSPLQHHLCNITSHSAQSTALACVRARVCVQNPTPPADWITPLLKRGELMRVALAVLPCRRAVHKTRMRDDSYVTHAAVVRVCLQVLTRDADEEKLHIMKVWRPSP
eukprot:7875906-Pyramimonas_sp.AAC.1